jgi:hypothetical protein
MYGVHLIPPSSGVQRCTTAGANRRHHSRLANIHPLAQIKASDIEELRRWARDALAIDANRGTPLAGGDSRSVEL